MGDKTREHVESPAIGNGEGVKAEQGGTAPGKEYILPLTSALLLSYGYIYVRAYYGAFGIDVHSFFTIQDYLTENIGNIYTLIIPTIISLFVPYGHGRGMVLFWTKKGTNKVIRIIDISFSCAILIFTLVLIYEAIKGGSINYSLLQQSSWFFWCIMGGVVIPKLFPETDKLNRLYYIFLCIFLPMSICNTLLTAKSRAQNTIENFINTNKEVTIKSEIEKELKIKSNALVLLGANSRYFFFYDPSSNSSHVIKAEAISRVTVTENPWPKQPATPIPYP